MPSAPPAEHVLDRDGRPPLAFTGSVLADASSQAEDGPLADRYHAVAIYRTAGGTLVGQVMLLSTAAGDPPLNSVYVAGDPPALAAALAAHDPTAGWSVPTADERQARHVREVVVAGFRAALSQAFLAAEIVDRID